MGLAQPKNRQRIGPDPQNKKWKKNEDTIGYKLLSKMGWSSGKGLGASESGIQENIKVSLKDNLYGVGADHKTSDNWLENAFAFDDLLKGMNNDSTVFVIPETTPKETSLSNRHAHRKKFVKNKKVANYEASQINNILGKTREGETLKEEKAPSPNPSDKIVDGLTTKSNDIAISDYFKAKMAAKGIVLGRLSSIEHISSSDGHADLSEDKIESVEMKPKKSKKESKEKGSKSSKKEKVSKKSKKEKMSKKSKRD